MRPPKQGASTNPKKRKPCTPRTLESLRGEFHPTLNGTLRFDDLTRGSHKMVWWYCAITDCETIHEWEAVVKSRTRQGNGCPFCANNQTCRCKSLGTKFPSIAAQLVDKTINPFTISSFSGQKLTWRCENACCETIHQWPATVKSRTGLGHGCPFCAKNSQTCRCKSLGTLFPKIAAQLVDKTIDPFTIPVSSDSKKLLWCCKNQCCETLHIYPATVYSRTGLQSGCPFCAPYCGKTCRCRSLGTLFPEIANQLTDKTIDPFTIRAYSNSKHTWKCTENDQHEPWSTSVNMRTGQNRTGCPTCNVNKGEARLRELQDAHDCVAEHWKRRMPCTDVYSGKVRNLEPDACGRTHSGRLYAIELDGPTHFESVDYLGPKPTDLHDQMRRDLAKNRTLWKAGYSLLRVSYLEFPRLDEIVNTFITDVDASSQQILRTSNNVLYEDLQRRTREALEGTG